MESDPVNPSPKRRDHFLVDWKWDFSLLGLKRFFIVIQFGKDRRNRANSANTAKMDVENRAGTPLRHLFLWGTVFLWLLAGGSVLSLGAAYILKSQLGINLLKHSHPVKEWAYGLGLCPSKKDIDESPEAYKRWSLKPRSDVKPDVK